MSMFSRIRPRTLILTLVPVAGLVLLGANYLSSAQEAPAPQNSATSTAAAIEDAITAVGTVTPKEHADLAFSRAGTITAMPYDAGTSVAQGTLLAAIDADEARAGVASAESELAASRAELAKSGISLVNAEENAASETHTAYASAEDAVKQRLDAFFSSDDQNPQLTFQTFDSQVENDLYTKRSAMTGILSGWQARLASPDLNLAKTNLTLVRTLLYRAQDALRTQVGLDDATIATYKASVTAGLAETNASLSAITGVSQAIRSAQADVAVAESRIAQSQAAIAQAKVSIAESAIYAPFSGIVTTQYLKRGEFAGVGKPVIGLASKDAFEIETDVPEAYIAKISAGKPVSITLDAYPDSPLSGTISSIEPAGRQINDVTYYRVKVAVTSAARGLLKNGLTANVTIKP